MAAWMVVPKVYPRRTIAAPAERRAVRTTRLTLLCDRTPGGPKSYDLFCCDFCRASIQIDRGGQRQLPNHE